ncbi:MAG: CU044_2847 family protein [Cyanobacteria bacterium J06636_28]
MEFGDNRTQNLPVEMPDGTIVQIEVAQTGREDVAFEVKPFDGVGTAIESIVKAIAGPIRKAKPDKASVTFGLEIGVEQGSLMAAIVKGTGNANLEVTLEWEK